MNMFTFDFILITFLITLLGYLLFMSSILTWIFYLLLIYVVSIFFFIWLGLDILASFILLVYIGGIILLILFVVFFLDANERLFVKIKWTRISFLTLFLIFFFLIFFFLPLLLFFYPTTAKELIYPSSELNIFEVLNSFFFNFETRHIQTLLSTSWKQSCVLTPLERQTELSEVWMSMDMVYRLFSAERLMQRLNCMLHLPTYLHCCLLSFTFISGLLKIKLTSSFLSFCFFGDNGFWFYFYIKYFYFYNEVKHLLIVILTYYKLYIYYLKSFNLILPLIDKAPIKLLVSLKLHVNTLEFPALCNLFSNPIFTTKIVWNSPGSFPNTILIMLKFKTQNSFILGPRAVKYFIIGLKQFLTKNVTLMYIYPFQPWLYTDILQNKTGIPITIFFEFLHKLFRVDPCVWTSYAILNKLSWHKGLTDTFTIFKFLVYFDSTNFNLKYLLYFIFYSKLSNLYLFIKITIPYFFFFELLLKSNSYIVFSLYDFLFSSNFNTIFLNAPPFHIQELGVLLFTIYSFYVFLLSLLFFICILGIVLITYDYRTMPLTYLVILNKKLSFWFNINKNKFFNFSVLPIFLYSNSTLSSLNPELFKFDLMFSSAEIIFMIFFIGCILFICVSSFVLAIGFTSFIRFIVIFELYFLSIIFFLIYFSLIHENTEGIIFIFILLAFFTVETVLGLALFSYKVKSKLTFYIKN